MFGKEKAKAKLIANLQQTYAELSKAHGISPGDFPDVRKMQEMLKDSDFSKFQSLRESYLKKVSLTFYYYQNLILTNTQNSLIFSSVLTINSFSLG